jgi:HK97 family phage major capsid protein
VYPVAEIYSMPVATQSLLSDSSIDIESWLTDSVGVAMATKEATAFISGDGALKPRGFTTHGTSADADFTRTRGVPQHIAAGATSPSDAQLVTALVSMTETLRPPYRPNAAWLLSRTIAARIRGLKDDSGRLIWSVDRNLVDGRPPLLLGYPVFEDDLMPVASANELPNRARGLAVCISRGR